MADPLSTLADDLIEVGRLAFVGEDADAVLRRIASSAPQMIDACDSCGISIIEGESVSTRAASSEQADRVDELQYRLGVGPCLSAISEGRSVSVPSFSDEGRWRDFCDHAIEHGVTASYSVPLNTSDGVVGSLNLYSSSDRFRSVDERLAELLAAQAAIALGNARAMDQFHRVVEQLQEALDSRDVIGQAKGLLMGELGIGADEAFDHLRNESQRRNEKLRDVAAGLVARRTSDGT